MGELLVLLCIVGLVWLVLKVIGALFHVTFALLALPFQILAALGVVLVSLVLVIPLALVTGVLGILVAPFLLLAPLLPFIIIGLGLFLVLRRNPPARHSPPPAGTRGHLAGRENPTPQP